MAPMRALRILLPVGLVFLLGLPALAADKAPAAAATQSPILASLERTACYGTCPIYTVTVHTDGTVEYQGKRFVKVMGPQVAKLSPDQVKALREAFAQAKYFELKGTFDCLQMTDLPWAITRYREAGKERSIRHYFGCRGAPEALKTLERRIDEIVGTERWVGTKAERKNLRR
jgi:hypothetical protein